MAQTPGPWHVNGIDAILSIEGNRSIAKVYHPEDDGALIAAAPDLLAALRAIVEEWGEPKRFPVPQGHPKYGTGETYLSPAACMIRAELTEQARAAIAKAS